MQSPIQSDASISESLGLGLAVEYTRDSPLFLQQITAYEESCEGFSPYCSNMVHALEVYVKALTTLQAAQRNLQAALTGKQNSRCLYTNAVPALGDLNHTLSAAGELVMVHADNMKVLADNVSQLIPVFKELSITSDLTSERALMKQVEKDRQNYEKQLIAALKVRKKHTDTEINTIVQTRSAFELGRFDLVRKLNYLDTQKKVHLTEAACALSSILDKSVRGNTNACHTAEIVLSPYRKELQNTEDTMARNDRLWDGLRERLRGELLGALPPPGAPLGALSIAPNGPVSHFGSDLFSINLFTEVLSARTRAAKIADSKLVTAEGIYKQGYLIVESKYLGARGRRWFRLFESTLYKLDTSIGGEFSEVCNVVGATVQAKPGSVPHKFIITTKSDENFVFQAENADNAMMWVWALRRCGARGGVTDNSRDIGVGGHGYFAGDNDEGGEKWLIHNGPGKQSSIAGDACVDSDVAPLALPSLSLLQRQGQEHERQEKEENVWNTVQSTEEEAALPTAAAHTDTCTGTGADTGAGAGLITDDFSSMNLQPLTEFRGRRSYVARTVGAETSAGAGTEVVRSVEFSTLDTSASTETAGISASSDGESRLSVSGATGDRLSDSIAVSDCTVVFGAVHSDLKSHARSRSTQNENHHVVHAPGPNAHRVNAFLEKFPHCAECNAPKPIWISVNYGISLCEDCAGMHARLGSTTSKLRHVLLDDLSDWQCDLLQEELGNSRVLQVMEASVPAGWTKPQANSTLEDKWQWCDAKYRWYAFVSDGSGNDEYGDIPVGIRDSLGLQAGLMDAVKKGHVLGALWWLVHRADINALYPPASGVLEARSPLHEAVAHGQINMVAFLCLSGADVYQQDGRGNSALAYVEGHAFAEVPVDDRKLMKQIFFNILRVDC